MNNVIYKELKLSASLISYLFIAFGLIFLLPGYPILCGVFFVTLGIFKSFENYVETNDIIFSALLPISKKEIVKGKYIFVCLIELCSLLIMGVIVILRGTIFIDTVIYQNNMMMNANCFALGVAFILFSLFNLIFVDGFFKTTYKKMKPFVIYMIIVFIGIGIAETLHHIPGLNFLNAFENEYIKFQILSLIIGIIFYVLVTYFSYRKSCKSFEKINL